MSDEREAIERLERRVAQLEAIVRQLAAGRAPAPPPAAPPQPPPPRQPPLSPRPVAKPAVDVEQLVGQRGLLIVGVLALIATAGFFLKYAFERGWIPPELRVLGGVVLGVAIAALGERLVAPPRSLRTYGAALIGGGGALVYLAVWAAAGPYALVGRSVGTGLLFATTAAVALRALFHRVEPLSVWALIGAYLAPVFLPRPVSDPAWFWGYIAVVGVAAGALASRFAWRTTLDIALTGYYLLPSSVTFDALASPTGMAFLAAGGVGALLATGVEGRRWPEARLGAPLVAWLTLVTHTGWREPEAARWAALLGGAAIVAVCWWQTQEGGRFQDRRNVRAEDLVFLVNPAALGVLADALGPRSLDRWAGVVPAAVAALYLVPGWRRRAAPFVALGGALLAIAIGEQWDGSTVTVGLALLAAGAVFGEGRYGVPARELAVGLLGAAFVQVFVVTLADRSTLDRAFSGSWSLGWYALLVAVAFAGRWWPARANQPPGHDRWQAALWTIGGLAVFVGGSVELWRFFHGLARDLSLSAFWIVYAGALVQVGFWEGQKAVRAAGLAVAGLAVVKIAFYDLANLSALYRVGSFFVLSLIALAVAYAYNKRR